MGSLPGPGEEGKKEMGRVRWVRIDSVIRGVFYDVLVTSTNLYHSVGILFTPCDLFDKRNLTLLNPQHFERLNFRLSYG